MNLQFFPGCTEEICVPILEKISGLSFNDNFFVVIVLKELIQATKSILLQK